VALLPRDPRLAREVELLSRVRHPSIPRLWDSGEWQSPGGTLHPYIAMEWVEGVPLYDWARQHAPSPAQQLRVLEQLASALQAIHAHGGVHRDVKGDNVLVRRSDSRAILIDFGTGHFPDAPTLTPPGFQPGTPAYRSPESALFELQSLRNPAARYRAGPADDLYALGVTACRLVTGEYPEFAEPTQDEHGTWHLETVVAPASLQHLEPRLRDWILRMLSVHPGQRGTAAPGAPREAPAPLLERSSLPSGTPARISARARMRLWSTWPVAAAASLALTAGVWWRTSVRPRQERSTTHWASPRAEQPDAGPTGLGEALASASTQSSHAPREVELLAEDTPPEPLPGQDVPDARGRCPRKQQVALNGGCWAEFQISAEECEEKGGSFFKKKCYLPITARVRRPTSSPADPQRRSPP
jgi:eukaryotic-like serine/threonine-protein kinase